MSLELKVRDKARDAAALAFADEVSDTEDVERFQAEVKVQAQKDISEVRFIEEREAQI